jgi:hypothetical protein
MEITILEAVLIGLVVIVLYALIKTFIESKSKSN